MQKLVLAAAVLGTAFGAAAQCAGTPPPQTFVTLDPFGANFYVGSPSPLPAAYTGYNIMFDLQASSDITINGFETWLYDNGVVNPDQTGQTAVVNVYTCANAYAGSETILPSAPGSPWTLAGSGTILVVSDPANSPITLNAPITITQGNYGVAIEIQPPTTGATPGPLHPLITSPAPNPAPADFFISMTNMAIQRDAFVDPAVAGNLAVNLQIDYTPSAQAGFVEQFGDGCYFRPTNFYEDFDNTNNLFDLANTSFTMFPTGTSYQVVPIASAFVAPASTSLTASAPPVTNTASWDDALSAPITLPFAFPLPTGSTTDITIGSNGFVFFEAVTDTNAAFAYYNSIGDVRDFPARLAPFYGDLDPGAGAGGIFYDVISPNEVRITFDQVEEWSPAGGGPTNTFQIVLQSSGGMEVIYQGMALTTAPAITAFTLGNGDRLAPQRDISATLPFQTGDGAIPPVLNTDARPVLGTNINWFLTGITPGTPLVFLVTGVSTTAAPIPLNFLGMPGCFQYITPQDTWLMNIDTNTWTATTPIQIPNNPVFVGANLFGQAAPFTVGLNAAGILSSNGTCIKVGPF